MYRIINRSEYKIELKTAENNRLDVKAGVIDLDNAQIETFSGKTINRIKQYMSFPHGDRKYAPQHAYKMPDKGSSDKQIYIELDNQEYTMECNTPGESPEDKGIYKLAD